MTKAEILSKANTYDELYHGWASGNTRAFPEGTTVEDLWDAMEAKRMLALQVLPALEPSLWDHLPKDGQA